MRVNKNKRDAEESQGGDQADPPRKLRVEKLIPLQGSLYLSQRRYKSPSPARFEERYKRVEVGTTFIPRADLYLTV